MEKCEYMGVITLIVLVLSISGIISFCIEIPPFDKISTSVELPQKSTSMAEFPANHQSNSLDSTSHQPTSCKNAPRVNTPCVVTKGECVAHGRLICIEELNELVCNAQCK